MNKRFHILLVLGVLSVLFAVTGCKSNKSLTKARLRDFTATQLITEVENNNFEFESFQAKMNVKIETGNKSHNVKGQLRMICDSIVWTSISLPMGLEIVRLKVTPDSVYLINRNDKTYLLESISSFNDISPMITDLHFIQSVLVGNDINLHDNDNYNVTIDNNQYNLLISKQSKKTIKHSQDEWKVMMKDIWIDPQLLKITKYYIKEYNDDKRKIDVEYSDFQEVNGKYIPTKIKLSIRGDVTLRANVTYSNIVVGENVDCLFNVPKKYDRVFK